MRNFNQLTPDDFPGIDNLKFEQWKKMRIKANKMIFISIMGLLLLSIINLILIYMKVYGDIPNNGLIVYCIILLAYCIIMILIGYKPNKLQKKLGITRKNVAEALNKEQETN
jgi:hypothetical protein